MMSHVCVSVISIYSHTSEARGLEIGMYNSNIDGSKVTGQILDILLISWDIKVKSFIFTSVYNTSYNFKAKEKFIK